jgi:flagellin-specific chaperone FliS
LSEIQDRNALPGLDIPADMQLLVVGLKDVTEEQKKKINAFLGEMGLVMDANLIVLDRRTEMLLNTVQQDLDRAKHVARTGNDPRLIQYIQQIRDQFNGLLDYLNKKEKARG